MIRRILKSLRLVVLPLSLLSTGIASAHVSDDGIREAGFSRVKLPSRDRDWRNDPMAIGNASGRPMGTGIETPSALISRPAGVL